MQVPIELKMQCVRLIQQGNTIEKVYDYFYKEFPECDIDKEHFRKRLNAWQKKEYPDEITLRNGTYKNFTPHGATVQVNSDGIITQAWIKQNSNIVSPEEFIKIIKKNRIEKFSLEKKQNENSITLASDMLEIPLFDMHWGISYYENYETVLAEIIKLVSSKQWDKIIIPFGQDYFHNDSIINGITTKGTNIQKVDMIKAIKDGQKFIYSLIDACIEFSNNVKVIYTPGNHDHSISWMFMEILLERYGPIIVDDKMLNRKIITYGSNAIMFTHGSSKKATDPKKLALVFLNEFSLDVSGCNVKEIHAGHFHSETDVDVGGVMVRRLSTRAITDSWSDHEDYVGTHKRFMLFIWDLNKLKEIYYI